VEFYESAKEVLARTNSSRFASFGIIDRAG